MAVRKKDEFEYDHKNDGVDRRGFLKWRTLRHARRCPEVIQPESDVADGIQADLRR